MLTSHDRVYQRVLLAGTLFLSLLLLGWRTPLAVAANLVALRVGISDRVNTVLPLWMAEAGGFYAAQGLKVETVIMGGGSQGAQELQAGRIDVMRVGLSSVIRTKAAIFGPSPP